MSAKKQRDKTRRRASKLAQQAWEAAEAGNFHLAIKVIRRAVELHPANPVLWHDQGTLLLRLDEEDEAARSFEAAILVAPHFAEAYASLAAMRARQGIAEQAVALQHEAVRCAPNVERHRDTLTAYEALVLGRTTDSLRSSRTRADPWGDQLPPPSDGLSELATRIAGLNWEELDGSLTRRGAAYVPGRRCCCDTRRAVSMRRIRIFAATCSSHCNSWSC